MSAQTPQRIDKIPDREDLETEIRRLKALCEELREALADLIPMAEAGRDDGFPDDGELDQARAALKKAQKP
jgi:hypothetical protein